MRPSWDYKTPRELGYEVGQAAPVTQSIPKELLEKLTQTAKGIPGKAYDMATGYVTDASAGYIHQLLNAAIAARLLNNKK